MQGLGSLLPYNSYKWEICQPGCIFTRRQQCLSPLTHNPMKTSLSPLDILKVPSCKAPDCQDLFSPPGFDSSLTIFWKMKANLCSHPPTCCVRKLVLGLDPQNKPSWSPETAQFIELLPQNPVRPMNVGTDPSGAGSRSNARPSGKLLHQRDQVLNMTSPLQALNKWPDFQKSSVHWVKSSLEKPGLRQRLWILGNVLQGKFWTLETKCMEYPSLKPRGSLEQEERSGHNLSSRTFN